MIESLKALCEKLSVPDMTAEQAAEVTGTLIEANVLSLSVRPDDPAFKAGKVVRLPEAGFSHVELDLATPAVLSDLVAALGEPTKPPRIHAGQTESRVFRLGNCRLIARVGSDEQVEFVELQPDEQAEDS